MASLIFIVSFVFLGFLVFFPVLVLGSVGVSVLTGIFVGRRLFVVDLTGASRSGVGVASAIVQRVLAHEIIHATTISTWSLV